MINFGDQTTTLCSKNSPGIASNAEPTSICRPMIIKRFPPEDAPRTINVATVREATAMKQRMIPKRSTPSCMRAPIIKATPNVPAKSPKIPIQDSRSPNITQPANPTARGIVEAIIEAKEASIDCIATKFSPKYSAF